MRTTTSIATRSARLLALPAVVLALALLIGLLVGLVAVLPTSGGAEAQEPLLLGPFRWHGEPQA